MSTIDHTGRAVALRDGSSVLIRPGRPEDRELLLAGFERLGPESRYERFLAPMAELTDEIVTYLTDIDHHDHEALHAIDAATGEGVGVARFNERFSALLLAENREMLELLETLGPVQVVDRQSGTVEIEAELAQMGAGPVLHGVLGASARWPLRLGVRPRGPGRADPA